MSPRAIIKCLAFCLRMAVKMRDATMKRRDGVFKGKSRLLYSPRQCWHDVCVLWFWTKHGLVVATSGFTQIGIRGGQAVG